MRTMMFHCSAPELMFPGCNETATMFLSPTRRASSFVMRTFPCRRRVCRRRLHRRVERTHKFALRIKIHRSDFLSLCHVCIWANGIPAYAFWRDAKVMCDGGYVYDAHSTRERVLGGCNQSREQQLREVKVTYERAVWLICHQGLYGKGNSTHQERSFRTAHHIPVWLTPPQVEI